MYSFKLLTKKFFLTPLLTLTHVIKNEVSKKTPPTFLYKDVVLRNVNGRSLIFIYVFLKKLNQLNEELNT